MTTSKPSNPQEDLLNPSKDAGSTLRPDGASAGVTIGSAFKKKQEDPNAEPNAGQIGAATPPVAAPVINPAISSLFRQQDANTEDEIEPATISSEREAGRSSLRDEDRSNYINEEKEKSVAELKDDLKGAGQNDIKSNDVSDDNVIRSDFINESSSEMKDQIKSEDKPSDQKSDLRSDVIGSKINETIIDLKKYIEDAGYGIPKDPSGSNKDMYRYAANLQIAKNIIDEAKRNGEIVSKDDIEWIFDSKSSDKPINSSHAIEIEEQEDIRDRFIENVISASRAEGMTDEDIANEISKAKSDYRSKFGVTATESLKKDYGSWVNKSIPPARPVDSISEEDIKSSLDSKMMSDEDVKTYDGIIKQRTRVWKKLQSLRDSIKAEKRNPTKDELRQIIDLRREYASLTDHSLIKNSAGYIISKTGKMPRKMKQGEPMAVYVSRLVEASKYLEGIVQTDDAATPATIASLIEKHNDIMTGDASQAYVEPIVETNEGQKAKRARKSKDVKSGTSNAKGRSQVNKVAVEYVDKNGKKKVKYEIPRYGEQGYEELRKKANEAEWRGAAETDQTYEAKKRLDYESEKILGNCSHVQEKHTNKQKAAISKGIQWAQKVLHIAPADGHYRPEEYVEAKRLSTAAEKKIAANAQAKAKQLREKALKTKKDSEEWKEYYRAKKHADSITGNRPVDLIDKSSKDAKKQAVIESKYSAEVIQMYMRILKALGCESPKTKDVYDNILMIHNCIKGVAGMWPDRDGNMWDKIMDENNEVFLDFIEWSSIAIEESMKLYGIPNAVTSYALQHHPHSKTYRVPLPCITPDVAKYIVDHKSTLPGPKLQTLGEIYEAQRIQWIGDKDHIGKRDMLASEIQMTENPGKMKVLEDSLRCMFYINSQNDGYALNLAAWGVDLWEERPSYADMAKAHQSDIEFLSGLEYDDKVLDHELNIAYLMRCQEARRRCEFTDKSNPRTQEKIVEHKLANGEVIQEKKFALSTCDSVLIGGINLIKTVHIFGSAPLAATAPLEYGVGIAESMMGNTLLRDGDLARSPKELYEYTKTNKTYQSMLFICKELFDLGGAKMLMAYKDFLNSSELPINQATFEAFMHENRGQFSSATFAKVSDICTKLSRFMQTGQDLWKGMDCKLWLSSFMTMQSMADGITTEEMLSGMKFDMQGFMKTAMLSGEGIEAFNMMAANNGSRNSILVSILRDICADNGINQAIIAIVFDNFFVNYAIKALELAFPFSNCLQLMVARCVLSGKEKTPAYSIMFEALGGYEVWAAENGMDELGPEKKKEYLDRAYRKCLTYDLMKMGPQLTIIAIMSTLAICGGLKPPDDDDDDDESKWLYIWEWQIRMPWWPEGEFMPLKQSWFADDIFRWAMPVAIPLLATYGYGGKYGFMRTDFPDVAAGVDKTFTVEDGMNMFWIGLDSIYDGNAVWSSLWSMLTIVGYSHKLCDYMDEDGKFAVTSEQKNDDPLGAWAAVKTNAAYDEFNLERRLAKFLNYVTGPMALTQIWDLQHQGEYEKTGLKWIDSNGDPQDHDTGISQYLANYSLHNNILASLCNFMAGREEYGWNAADFAYEPDPVAAAAAYDQGFESHYSRYKEAVTAKNEKLAAEGKDLLPITTESEQKKVWANRIIKQIYDADSPDDLKFDGENGLILSLSDAKELKGIVMTRLTKLYKQVDQLNKDYSNGKITKTQYYARYNGISPDIYKLKKVKSTILLDGFIYDKEAYKVVHTDSVKDPLTGEYYYYGNTKGVGELISPFVTPEKGDVNWRTIYDEETGDQGNRGGFRTESLYNDRSTAPKRYLVPNEDNRQISAFGDEWTEEEKELEELYSNSSSSSSKSSYGGYSGYGRRSYGSGGSSYSPKIYSSHYNVYSGYAATMNSKTPYSSSSTYLRPGYTTQGSRQAYARSDI